MDKTKKLVLNGLMIALVCVATMVIQIPTPGTNGYVNVGDGIIFMASIVFGPIPGMIAGGIGSALADILSGYAQWAIFTLIIKGLEGYIVGLIVIKFKSKIITIIALIVGIIVMVFGYYLAGGVLEGFAVSLTSIPSNIIQGSISAVIALPLSHYLNKVAQITKLKDNKIKA